MADGHVVSNFYLKLDTASAILGSPFDASSYVRSFNFSRSKTVIDKTCTNDSHKKKKKGLPDGTLEVTFAQDWTDDGLDEILDALYDGDDFAFEFAYNGSTPSAANPVWKVTGFLEGYPPMQGSPDTLAEVTCTFQINSITERDVTP